MTVAIKRENGSIIWFDAVLQFNRQRTASVSKHPLETGSFVTDHTTTENPIFTVSGLITDVDFNLQRPVVSTEDAKSNSIKTKPFVNNDPLVDPTVTIQSDGGKYSRYLPESVTQFLEDSAPSVAVTPITRSKTSISIEEDFIQIWKTKELITLVEFSGSKVKSVYNNCVLTNLSFNETPDSGDALWPSMTFEQVSFAKSSVAKIPQNVTDKMKNKAAATNGKGNQAVAATPSSAQTTGPTSYSTDTSSQLIKTDRSYSN
jgi:hypothetical protein